MSETTASKVVAPVPPTRIKQICADACASALGDVDTSYTHSMTETWNSNIINGILRSLISESTPTSATPSSNGSSCPYKFAVNSTIIQHAAASRAIKAEDEDGSAASAGGKRGMHSSCGGFWNTEKDGMWAYKHQMKEMDIVISIIWIAI